MFFYLFALENDFIAVFTAELIRLEFSFSSYFSFFRESKICP